MSEILSWVHGGMRSIHIILGFTGLVLFWGVMAIKKGTRSHVRLGKIYAWTVLIVGGTALVGSSWALLHFESYSPGIHAIPNETVRLRLQDQSEYSFSILLYLSGLTVAGAMYGLRIIKFRSDHASLQRSSVPWWHGLAMLISIGIFVFGAYRFATGGGPNGGMSSLAYQVQVILGLIGIGSMGRELRFIWGSKRIPRDWLYIHVEQMLGTGVAFHTAFIVFGASRLFNYQLPGAWNLLPWIVPPIVGVTLSNIYIGRLKRRFERPNQVEDTVTLAMLAEPVVKREAAVIQVHQS